MGNVGSKSKVKISIIYCEILECVIEKNSLMRDCKKKLRFSKDTLYEAECKNRINRLLLILCENAWRS